ncbi:MAG TPA: Uma2 family endonuclease [Urbifossiella sp.]|nr:Uma2 family endonuclease [Urbifossiella sp.]
MPQLAIDADLVLYPSSDGQPMGETWIHVQTIMMLTQAMEVFFEKRSDALITSDMFWYWERGNKSAVVAPDVMVILGLKNPDPPSRRSYFSWKEGGLIPAVVFEIASENTYEEDLDEKLALYERLGVPEYFLYDPEGFYLKPALQGFRLKQKKYRRIRTAAMESRLGFRLRGEGTMLRVIDAKTGKPIPSNAEIREALLKTQSQAVKQAQRAAAETQRAAAEAQRAAAEKERADLLAAEVERLKQQLGRSGA